MYLKNSMKILLLSGVLSFSFGNLANAQQCASISDVNYAYSVMRSAQDAHAIAQGELQGYWGSQAHYNVELAYSDNVVTCGRNSYSVTIQECMEQAEELRVLDHNINISLLEDNVLSTELAAYDAQVVYEMMVDRPRCPE